MSRSKEIKKTTNNDRNHEKHRESISKLSTSVKELCRTLDVLSKLIRYRTKKRRASSEPIVFDADFVTQHINDKTIYRANRNKITDQKIVRDNNQTDVVLH